jgi:hypothetical protein
MRKLNTPAPQFDVAKLFGAVLGSARTTVRLHPRQPSGPLAFTAQIKGLGA